MYTLLLSFSIVAGLMACAMFLRLRKAKPKGIRIYKHQNDTSDANYAINEHGFLERIHHNNLSKHSG